MSETVYLRPSSDVSLSHSCSSGSRGYSMMSEATADGDSTYIYIATNGSSSITTTSKFGISNNIGLYKKITSAKFVVNMMHNASENMGEATHTLEVTIGSSSDTFTASKSYTDYSFDLDVSDITFDYTTGEASVTATFKTVVQPLSGKDAAAFQLRITQAYIELEIEDIKSFYIKVNGSWKYVKAYRKVNGAWNLLGNNQPTDWSSGGKIKT